MRSALYGFDNGSEKRNKNDKKAKISFHSFQKCLELSEKRKVKWCPTDKLNAATSTIYSKQQTSTANRCLQKELTA